jgi:hypothetical protein
VGGFGAVGPEIGKLCLLAAALPESQFSASGTVDCLAALNGIIVEVTESSMLASPNDADAPAASLNLIEDPRYWRDRAEEARAMADEITDPVAIASLLETTKHYERVARYVEVHRHEGR